MSRRTGRHLVSARDYHVGPLELIDGEAVSARVEAKASTEREPVHCHGRTLPGRDEQVVLLQDAIEIRESDGPGDTQRSSIRVDDRRLHTSQIDLQTGRA